MKYRCIYYSAAPRLRHFATVLTLIPSSRFNAAFEARDRCMTARISCIIVALPCKKCPIELPSDDRA